MSQSPVLPTLPALVPHRGGQLTARLFRAVFKAQRWRMLGEFPNLPKAVAIVSPHTSNFDAWYGFNALLALDLQVTVFAKHTLFKTALKPVLQWMGAVPVVRDSPQGFTQQVIDHIQQQERIWIAMAPEGTRKNARKIRSGFYRIATAANIPIVMFSLDYAHKAIHILWVFQPTGHYEHDLEHILQCYSGQFSPKHPERLAAPLQKVLKNH